MSAKDCDRQLLDWLARNGFASYAGGLAKNGIITFDQFKVIQNVDELMEAMKMHKIFRKKFSNAFNEQFGDSANEKAEAFKLKPITTSVTPTPDAKPQATRFTATSFTPAVPTQKKEKSSIHSPHPNNPYYGLSPQQIWKMKKKEKQQTNNNIEPEPEPEPESEEEEEEDEDDESEEEEEEESEQEAANDNNDYEQKQKLMELEAIKRREELKLAQEKAHVEEERRKLEEMKQMMEQQQQQIKQQRAALEFQEQQKLKELEIEAQKLKQKELIQQQENIRIERERIKLDQDRQQKELALKEEEMRINKLREERQQIFYEKEEKELHPMYPTMNAHATDDKIAPLQTLSTISTDKALNITNFMENSDDEDSSDVSDGDTSYVSSIISAHSVDHHINNVHSPMSPNTPLTAKQLKEKKKRKKRRKKKRKKKKKKKKLREKKKKEKAMMIINDDNSYAMNAMWDEPDAYNHHRHSTDSSSLSDENAGLSSKKKKKKKKGKKTVLKSAKHEKMLDPKYRKKEKEAKNLSRMGFKIKPNHRYRIDDGRIGICKFRGRTLFGKSSEDWAGILVEYGDGVHNGSVKGKTYFRCADGKGIMLRPIRIIEDLGLSDGMEITQKMIKGSKQIQRLLQEIAYENQLQYEQRVMDKKRKKKHQKHNREHDDYHAAESEWKPPNFGDEYEEDHSDVFKPRNMYSQTLFKNDTKADKKLMMYEL